MTTATIQNSRVATKKATFYSGIERYNKYAFVSSICAGLFILYFFVPHVGTFGSFFRLNILFVMIAPLAGFIFSIMSVRQIMKTHDRGLVMSIAALVVTSLYFIVALATPLVLLICYIVYVYVLH